MLEADDPFGRYLAHLHDPAGESTAPRPFAWGQFLRIVVRPLRRFAVVHPNWTFEIVLAMQISTTLNPQSAP